MRPQALPELLLPESWGGACRVGKVLSTSSQLPSLDWAPGPPAYPQEHELGSHEPTSPGAWSRLHAQAQIRLLWLS